MKMQIYLFIFTFLLAFLLSIYLTPMVREAAIKFGLLSHPDGFLRTHKQPVPYLGGVAIYLGFLLALALTFRFEQMVLGILLGGTIMLLVGLIDDFGVMTPWMKLFGQVIAVVALLKSGVHIKIQLVLDVEPWEGFPLLSYLLSALWLLAMSNAFNFLDIEDGLASGVAFFASLSLFAVALINHLPVIATLTIALAGAILGFLRHNFIPARIYLGDGGSLFLGLILGALAMIGSYTERNILGLVAPVLILGVACFEIGFTMLARFIRGIPVMQGSPDHVAKRLQGIGLGPWSTVLVHYIAAFILGALAIAVMLAHLKPALTMVSIIALTALIITGLLLRVKVESPKDMQGKPDEEK
jgi:UDP-GlcNAc:undecaprenyl-phosphate GlcNAc-1-phosphate transferase